MNNFSLQGEILNKVKRERFHHKNIHQFFEKQAEKTPDNIALVYRNKSCTYRELNEKSNQLARYIRSECFKGQGSSTNFQILIILYFERSFEMVIALLATLKSGAAYVPIDPEFPRERIKYILEDTNSKIILTQSYYIKDIKHFCQSSITVPVDLLTFHRQ